MAIRYSVIIPAYNAERTIERCLDSVLNQPHDEVEIILVNDGSVDRTGLIARKYQKEYPEIVYLEQNNAGVSAARNAGIDAAAGKYLLFLDSDDYLAADYFEIVGHELCGLEDLLMTGRTVDDGMSIRDDKLRSCYSEDISEIVKILCKDLKKQILNHLGTKLFRTGIIRQYGIRFDEKLHIGEDKVFVLEYITHIKSLRQIPDCLYVISLENKESLSRKKRPYLYRNVMREHRKIFKTIEISELSEKDKQQFLNVALYSYYRSAFTVISELDKYHMSGTKKLEYIHYICSKYNSQSFIQAYASHNILIALPIKDHESGLIQVILKHSKRMNPNKRKMKR